MAHYNTATKMGEGDAPSVILIRSEVHKTSKLYLQERQNRSGYIHDPDSSDRPHVTTSWKWDEHDETFDTGHGYTTGPGDFNVYDTSVTSGISCQTTSKGNLVWPKEEDIEKYHKREFIDRKVLDQLIGKHDFTDEVDWPGLAPNTNGKK